MGQRALVAEAIFVLVIFFSASAMAEYATSSGSPANVQTNVGVDVESNTHGQDSNDMDDSQESSSSYVTGGDEVVVKGDEDDRELYEDDLYVDMDLDPVQTSNTALQVELSNGDLFAIQVSPKQAAATAEAELNVNDCATQCEMRLEETKHNGESRAAYKVTAYKRARFLGLFPLKLSTSTEIDAQTGAVIKTARPWWASISTQGSADTSASSGNPDY